MKLYGEEYSEERSQISQWCGDSVLSTMLRQLCILECYKGKELTDVGSFDYTLKVSVTLDLA